MSELLSMEILPVVLTLGAYRIGLLCQKKFKSVLFNPILIGVVLVVVFLSLTGLSNGDYQAACVRISWLMTPATVCLAIPMYEQFQILRKNFPMILASVAVGAVSCLGMVLIFAAVFRFDAALTVSLLPKSVTSAIGVPLSQLSGGLAPVTTAAIILSGMFASMLGTTFCRIFRIEGPVAQGVAFGTAGHVIATAKAQELDPLTGAVSSLSLVVAGLLTSAVFPLITRLL